MQKEVCGDFASASRKLERKYKKLKYFQHTTLIVLDAYNDTNKTTMQPAIIVTAFSCNQPS
jgi:hypothetical protein